MQAEWKDSLAHTFTSQPSDVTHKCYSSFPLLRAAAVHRASWVLFYDTTIRKYGAKAQTFVPLDRINEITIMFECIPRCCDCYSRIRNCFYISLKNFLLFKVHLLNFYLFIQNTNGKLANLKFLIIHDDYLTWKWKY